MLHDLADANQVSRYWAPPAQSWRKSTWVRMSQQWAAQQQAAKCALVTDTGVSSLAKSTLKTIVLNSVPAISNAGLASALRVGSHQGSVAAVEALARNSPALSSAFFRNCDRITDDGISMLAENCRALKALDLHRCCVSDTSLVQLAKNCGQLESLDLGKQHGVQLVSRV